MARPIIPLTPARLREQIHYDPETGEFRWLQTRSGRHGPVGIIEHVNSKYARLIITIDYGRYKAHHIAWFYMTGRWPVMKIDHINLNPLDNRWVNLREATDTVSVRNRGMFKNNTSGTTGVYFDKAKKKNPWVVWVYARWGGCFSTKEEAIARANQLRKDWAGDSK